MSYTGSCFCHKIEYKIKNKPIEIANCHCNLCKNIHNKNFVGFAKYIVNEVEFIIDNKAITNNILDSKYLKKIKSSKRAARYMCALCKQILFMYYYNSENIWLVVSTFKFSTDNIECYDIYKK